MTIDKFSLFRIISFTLAGGDVLQTIPATYRLYRKSWRKRSLTPLCFFYAMARYITILSLVSNGIGFFATDFNPASCKRFYMLPNITAMLAGMAVQVLVFTRTYAISGRSKRVYYGLGTVMLLLFPVQMFGIMYHRDPFMSHGGCKGEVLHANEPDWNIVYYSAHMTFDLLACGTGTFYLVFSSWSGGVFNTSKFVRRVLRNGLLYFLVVFLVNLWVVLEFAHVFSSGAASTLPLAVVLIAAQHLIISTQHLTPEDGASTEPYRDSSATRSGPPLFNRNNTTNTTQDVELQSGVFVVAETYVQPPKGDGKIHYGSADRKLSLDRENASVGSIPSVAPP
ncbi:hypothetical protein DFH07DRAFT_516615 [Mycena maculata]|uniref:Uncharacterized protein n=1 Tax=Mycena maculata TaxID=230809 RepID=A0AAD7NB06_9AGAR|nr:hypothetical protein DFH07DRAFT_516615 [Mycena maculata]